MRFNLCLGVLLIPLLLLPATAQDLGGLPDWARPHAQAAQGDPSPLDADAWVLFDRTEVAYVGDGEIRTRRLRVVKVLSERGTTEGTFRLYGLGGKNSIVKKLRGWNLRPDGELTKLDQDKVITIDNMGSADVSTYTLTTAALPRVAKGSLLAFESLQSIKHPMGPIDDTFIMQPNPVRRWELEPAKQEGWFTSLKKVGVLVDRRHFNPWLPRITELGEHGIAADQVPPLPKDEADHPAAHNVLPQVFVRFQDPDFHGAPPLNDWNQFAAWTYRLFDGQVQSPTMEGLKDCSQKKGLERITQWMSRELHYRAIYLSPERGWVPMDSAETARRRYGDCKDLACFLIGNLQPLGMRGYPVLARILDGVIEEDDPPYLLFNHAIAAIRLDHSLGWASEVETPQGRFLLVDPTDRFTPLGFLGEVHRNGRVLICTPEGGIWVQIPRAAIQASKVKVTLAGAAAGPGELRATLTFLEWGDAWRLRSTTQAKGLKELRNGLLNRVLDLPPTADFEVESVGNPLELGAPFQVICTLRHPEGFQAIGGEYRLAPLGWKIVSPPLQKPGMTRHYPVRREAQPDLEFDAELRVAFRCIPVLPARVSESPFRAYSWIAHAETEGTGTHIRLHLQHAFKAAFFTFLEREDGVVAARKDRSDARNLIADALSFKPLP